MEGNGKNIEKMEPGEKVITDEVKEIIKEERKLSRKFSGIADILERKMAAAAGSKCNIEGSSSFDLKF